MAAKVLAIFIFMILKSCTGVRITERDINQCIASDFSFFNDFRVLVGDCRTGFAYVHVPHRCPDAIASSTFPGMFISFLACVRSPPTPPAFFSQTGPSVADPRVSQSLQYAANSHNQHAYAAIRAIEQSKHAQVVRDHQGRSYVLMHGANYGGNGGATGYSRDGQSVVSVTNLGSYGAMGAGDMGAATGTVNGSHEEYILVDDGDLIVEH